MMMMMSRGLPGRQAQPAAKSCPVEACRTWVDSMVIGLSLCPWAKPVRDSGGLRYSVTHAREAESLSAALLHEIDLLQADPEIETTIPVHPHIFADDFLAFTQYTQNTEAWMQDEGLVDDFQLVGFHPAHQFMNEESEDAGNFANRSPYPMIHLLRQESVTDAVDEHPNSVAIAQANARLLRGPNPSPSPNLTLALTLTQPQLYPQPQPQPGCCAASERSGWRTW